MKEKVYITRDEDSQEIWIWRSPQKGNWRPCKLKESDKVVWVRLENMDELYRHMAYSVKEFKNQFGFSIPPKARRCVQLDKKKLEERKNCLYWPKGGI